MVGDTFIGHERGVITVRCKDCGRRKEKHVSSTKTAWPVDICVRCLRERLGIADGL